MMLQRIGRKAPDLPTFWSDPFREMERFFSDGFCAPMFSMDRFFDRDRWLPATDVKEEGDTYVATVELPGLTKDEVEVTVEDNVVSVSGERKWEHEDGEEKGRFHRVERAYGKFARSFTLPRTVKAENVKAEFKDGVLRLVLPKSEEAEARHIDIA